MILTCPNCQTKVDHQWKYEIPDDEFASIHCSQCDINWRHTTEGDVRVYLYVNRWFDEQGNIHHFGIETEHSTIELARRNVRFNLIATPVDLVYAAENEADLFEFLADVSLNHGTEDDDQIGTLGWME